MIIANTDAAPYLLADTITANNFAGTPLIFYGANLTDQFVYEWIEYPTGPGPIIYGPKWYSDARWAAALNFAATIYSPTGVAPIIGCGTSATDVSALRLLLSQPKYTRWFTPDKIRPFAYSPAGGPQVNQVIYPPISGPWISIADSAANAEVNYLTAYGLTGNFIRTTYANVFGIGNFSVGAAPPRDAQNPPLYNAVSADSLIAVKGYNNWYSPDTTYSPILNKIARVWSGSGVITLEAINDLIAAESPQSDPYLPGGSLFIHPALFNYTQ